MDRLLSDQEIAKAVGYSEADGTAFIDSYEQNIANAQDAKTSKWWAERIEKQLIHCWSRECEHKTIECYFGSEFCKWWQSLKEAGL